MSYKQLIINPGSTSTKLALYDGENRIVQDNISHDMEQLKNFENIPDHLPFCLQVIQDFMVRNQIWGEELDAVVGRSSLVFGLHIGGYRVNEDLAEALRGKYSSPHASNLGGLLAKEVADSYGISTYIYDAVTSGELTDVVGIMGIYDIQRRSFCHVLNSRPWHPIHPGTRPRVW